ncbi:hypothetical protein ASG31_09495 [Chryseobacterium sp. Leaf404]|nr:hypothetical protein ASG31_09495 [Chryseobacterium sp. Leaf404]
MQSKPPSLEKKLAALLLLILATGCGRKKRISRNSGKDNESYAKARKFRDSGQKDSAFIYYNSAKIEYKKDNDSLGFIWLEFKPITVITTVV